MSVESNKNLAGIGALLIAIGSFTGVLTIVGAILLLIGLKGLAEAYRDNNIFQDALYAIIFLVIGGVAGVALFVMLAISGFAFFSIFAGVGIALGIIGALVVVFVFYLLAAIYVRRAMNALAQKTGEGMFATAGTLFLVGAVLTIILVGLILVFIAWLIAAIAFFSMKTYQQPAAPQSTYGPPP
jgi:uncharacterized membrane protein